MNPQLKIELKILAYKRPQRYAVHKAVVAALEEVHRMNPSLQVVVEEIRKLEDIQVFTPVTIYPSLMLNGRLVCVGRFPRREEIISWLTQEIENTL
jgi:hypothetical protein